MTTQEKLDACKDAVVATYTETGDFEACYAVCLGIDGIKFGDVQSIAKKILIDEGLFTTIGVRKENLIADLDGGVWDLNNYLVYSEYINLIRTISDETDIPQTWVKNKVNAQMKEDELEIPKKVKAIKGYKLQIIKCFKNNPEVTQEGLADCILNSGAVKAEENARYYAKEFHQFCKELLATKE